MKKEEHKKLLDDLKNSATDADRMSILLQLEQDYTSVLAERDTATTRATNAELESAKYAKLNNELWLQNSVQAQATKETPIDTDNTALQDQPAKRTYEDLESKF
jgi:hypothetical protein